MLSAALRGARVVLGDQEGWERPASARAASMRPLLHNSRLKMQCNRQLSQIRLTIVQMKCFHAYSSCDGREIQGSMGAKVLGWATAKTGRENWIYHTSSYHTEAASCQALASSRPSCCCCCCRCGCCRSKQDQHVQHNLAGLGR